MRLADEYDGAQERREVQGHGSDRRRVGDHNSAPTVGELGLKLYKTGYGQALLSGIHSRVKPSDKNRSGAGMLIGGIRHGLFLSCRFYRVTVDGEYRLHIRPKQR